MYMEKFSGEVANSKEFNNELNDEEKNVVFVLFYAKWCGHCKDMKEDWDNLNEFEMKNFKMMCIEDSNIDPELKKTHKIGGFPTLKIYNNGKFSDYESGRTFNDFEKHFSKHFVKCKTCGKKKKDPNVRTSNI